MKPQPADPPSIPLSTKPAAMKLSKETIATAKPSPPREVKKRQKANVKKDEGDIVERLQAICNPADPTKLYEDFTKIGQG